MVSAAQQVSAGWPALFLDTDQMWGSSYATPAMRLFQVVNLLGSLQFHAATDKLCFADHPLADRAHSSDKDAHVFLSVCKEIFVET